MQLQIRALQIAAGLFFLVGSPLLVAADAAPGEPQTLQKPSLDPTVDVAGPATAGIGAEESMSMAAQAAPAPLTPTLMDLTMTPTSLWQRIRQGFGLPDMASPLVTEQEEWYTRRPDYIARTVERSSRYLYYIVEQLEKRGIPTEIALLPIIESAYNPVAYSRAHASGIWQFIPSTGKHYGLQQNFWYDGRRDVTAATNAALDYLAKLYEMFGSWDLALASYNWGEGAVARSIAKNLAKGLATDYRSLNMPAETRYYIPKLQAVKNIIADPAQFGITLAEVPNQPYFVEVITTRHIDVKTAAKLAEMRIEDFQLLNPADKRPVIRADGERVLLFPADKAATFQLNLETHAEPLVSWQAYKLKAGETVDRLAVRHGISAAQLRHISGIAPKRAVGPGATLLVPSNGSAAPYLPDLPAPAVNVAKAPKKATKHASQKKSPGTTKQVTRKGGGAKVAHKTAKKTAAARQAGGKPPKKIVLAQKPR